MEKEIDEICCLMSAYGATKLYWILHVDSHGNELQHIA